MSGDLPVVVRGDVVDEEAEEALVVISYRGQVWRVRGALVEAQVEAVVRDDRGDVVRPPRRSFTMRLERVDYETEGTPRLVP